MSSKETIQRQQTKQAITALHSLIYRDYKARYPSMPDVEIWAIVKGKKYQHRKANGLTKWIVDYINYSGGFATRQQSQGQFNTALGKWTKSNVRKGVADITGVLCGKALNIEIKIGRDTQSEAQKKVQLQIERAGGLYFIAKDIVSSFNWINQQLGLTSEDINSITNNF